MTFLLADESCVSTVAGLAMELWPDHTLEYRLEDAAKVLKEDKNAVFLCLDGERAIGFAQFSLRFDYVEGTDGGPVGYLEGVYVLEEYRQQGIARQLVQIGEQWAREKGCSQLASDCELNNAGSLAFHLGSGFQEANRIICFVKNISEDQNTGAGSSQ